MGGLVRALRQGVALLQQIAEQDSVDVVGVSRDVRERVAWDALRAARVTYPNWFDPEGNIAREVRAVIPTVAVPATALVVDDQIVAVRIGPFDNADEFREYRVHL